MRITSDFQGTNAMILGSGIQILEGALAKAMAEGVTTPTFIEELDIKVKLVWHLLSCPF